tara:strand:- start:2157 stop:2735 length:579 start_codon:yes stop_codon:yes gene_type:complete
VGLVLRKQNAHVGITGPVDGSQIFGLFTDTNHITPQILGLGPEMTPGYLWMFAAGVNSDLGSGQLQMTSVYSTNTFFHFFSITALSNNAWLLPFGKPDHNMVYSDPTMMLCPNVVYENVNFPVWAMTQDMTGINTVDSWAAQFRCVRVPNDPSLVGTPFSAQSFRLQNDWNIYTGVYGPTLFASDEIAFAIS